MRFPLRTARVATLSICLALVATPLRGIAQSELHAPADNSAQQPSFPAAWPYRPATTTASSRSGMVACDDSLATDVGCQILREGGNAVDAAVATAFALAVVFPAAGNIGGGGFLVAHFADGTTATLDFRETAPARATHDMFLDSLGNLTGKSITGPLSVGVPGSVAGLWEAHARYGTLPWPQLLAPAIRLAELGFIVDKRFFLTVREDSARLSRYAASRMLFLPGGVPLREGTRWSNPDLAQVLRRIAEQGPAGFYAGVTADSIASSMIETGGLVTKNDLARYRAVWRTPITFTYRAHQIVTMPPPSSGGITLALIGNILGGFDLGHKPWHSPLSLHLLVESMRRAFVNRNDLLADPDFVHVPQDSLLSQSYAAHLRSTISPARATAPAEITPMHEGVHTTHLSVVDKEGNAVALTTTLNLLYGSAVTVAGAGFLLNDEMDDFASKPGTPNVFGLVQGEVNAIAPGKRMASSMTPTIVLGDDGRPLLVTGASGGPRIISAVFQVISNVLDYHFDIAAAVNAPRIHHQDFPDTLYFEDHGFSPGCLDSLKQMGYNVKETSHVGVAPSILRADGLWWGMADPRSGGSARGE
ncbi:MAG: gamma-glutamyltransferase [Bacteroidota bacterium]